MFGRWTAMQLFMVSGSVGLGGVVLVLLLVFGAPAWILALIFIGMVLVAAEVAFRISRSAQIWVAFLLRPREWRANASHRVSTRSEGTVQDMIRVAAVLGPYVQMMDGTVAMLLAVEPPPTSCMSAEEKERVCRAFQQALVRAARSGVELFVYADLQPDLYRVEAERHCELLAAWPADDPFAQLYKERIDYHWHFGYFTARRVAYHIRLSLADMAVLGEQRTPVEYLRTVADGVIQDLQNAGLRLAELSPEPLRDLMICQLDPATWWQAEPARGVAWDWPAGQETTTEGREGAIQASASQ